LRGLRAKGSGLTASAPTASAQALSPQPSALALRPLLKWAGGKRQLLPYLRRFYPPVFNRYIEPFFGSGAVFFDLHAAGRLQDREVVLIDANADLIGCYETVRAQPDAVGHELDRLAAAPGRVQRGSRLASSDLWDRLGAAPFGAGEEEHRNEPLTSGAKSNASFAREHMIGF
jgi:hypothetical protein